MATQRLAQRLASLKQSRKFRSRKQLESRRVNVERLEDRFLMALTPPAILPNSGQLLNNGATMHVAPQELTFEFNDNIDATTIASGIRLIRAGKDGVFSPPNTPNSNDVTINPGFLGLGDDSRQVIMRFASPLPDDIYRIEIIGAGNTPLRDTAGVPFNTGLNHTVNFNLDLGAQVIAVVPQPVRRLPSGTLSQTDATGASTRNKIVVYFNNDDLTKAAPGGPKAGTAEDPSFYRLYVTRNTLDPGDDLEFLPTDVSYDPATDTAVLTFDQFTDGFENFSTNPLDDDGSRDPGKSWRLRIGTDELRRATTPSTRLGTTDPGSSFLTAHNIGNAITSGAQGTSAQFAQSIEAQTYTLQFPGNGTEPGHRDIPAELHLNGGPDTAGGIPTVAYNFRTQIGSFPNLITEAQKQRAREIFDLYSRYSGIQFVETLASGLTIATADLAANPNTPEPSNPGGVIGLAGGGLAIMDAAEVWNDQFGFGSTPAGFSWFDTAMHEIGHLLGLGHSYDLPPHTVMGESGVLVFNSPAGEPVFPGDHDIVHSRVLFRPDSKDIDMYKFTLDGTGVFTAESFAERLPNSSNLDTSISIYREEVVNGSVVRTLIARNDDYFSKDSYVELTLGPGTYYVGISASGNENYDPSIVDSGIGGTTQGDYEIKFNFRKSANNSLVDTVTPANPVPAPAIVDNTSVAFDGDADGTPGGVYNFWFRAAAPTGQQAFGKARTIFVDRAYNGVMTGSLAQPYNEIDLALAAAQPFDIVRIVGNGGADGDIKTLTDNRAYHIGFAGAGAGAAVLRDGSALNVPKDVTVMIDEGAIFQLQRAQISVGSTAPSIFSDRSGGALQVLGTPNNRVYFTSYNESGANRIGLDENSSNTPPSPADWGGLSFKTDLDRADGRFVHEEIGVFLNYVNHADIRYGGGQVNVNSVFQVVNAIDMTDARPTITHNKITRNADAAMAANPDSFEETNFHAPRYWPQFSNLVGYNPSGVSDTSTTFSNSYTLDYGRVGPDIHGNILADFDLSGANSVAVGAVTTATSTAGQTSATVSHTVLAGSNRLLLVSVMTDGNTDVSGITYRGVPLIQAIEQDSGVATGSAVEIWYLADPQVGVGDIVVTFAGSTDPSVITATNVTGVNPIDPIGVTAGAVSTAPGASISTSITTTAVGSVVFGAVSAQRGASAPFAPASGVVENWDLSTGTEVADDIGGWGGFRLMPSPGATTFGATSSVDDHWAVAAIEINAIGASVFSNTTNGLFVRTRTPAGSVLEELTVAGRFDDNDITHVVQENLSIRGTPSGPMQESLAPPITLVVPTIEGGGNLDVAAGPVTTFVEYKLVYVDLLGNEGQASDTIRIPLAAGATDVAIRLENLPIPSGDFVARRVYRRIDTSDIPGAPAFRLVSLVPAQLTTFVDPFVQQFGFVDTLRVLDTNINRARLDGSLNIDPAIIIKADGARFDVGIGANLMAEGQPGLEVIFTSLFDDRYGGGGIFDTPGDNSDTNPKQGEAGDWAGFFFGPDSKGSIDHSYVAFAGGLNRVEGTFAGFNTVEIHEADVRIAHSVFDNNADGLGGQSPADRFGRGFNAAGTIFVRGAQPVIIENTFLNNEGALININVNALNSDRVVDLGRQTSFVDRMLGHLDNNGPLIDENRLISNGINGMTVRGGTLTTEVVWDDTDIVHVLLDAVNAPDFHVYGGLRLESSPSESLVVKSLGDDAGINATGRPLEIDDRIGGIIQVLGQPGAPVVMTSLNDCSVGAGVTPDGVPQNDTFNAGGCGQVSTPGSAPYADIIVVMDETVTMGPIQNFSEQFILDLEAALQAAGIGTTRGPNRYGLLGFGGIYQGQPTFEDGHPLPVGPTDTDPLFGTAAEYVTAAQTMVTNGAREDGYLAMDIMFQNYSSRPDAAKFVIIATDEDRDDADGNASTPPTFATTLAGLQAVGYKLQGIVSVDIDDSAGAPALALDAQSNAYVDDGAGGFTVSPNGTFDPIGSFGTTIADYANMVFATGGLVGDIEAIARDPAQAQIFSEILASSIVVQAGGSGAGAGDWDGITIDRFAHDRNVETVLELESPTGDGQSNATPDKAQVLGALAPFEKGGDETLRLGYTIHGTLNRIDDQDVYSFTGRAGTEVWIDIDRTWHALDPIVELIDDQGNVLARSMNSPTESLGDSVPGNLGRRMQKTPPFEGADFYTTNPRDAGMRLVLHGPANSTNTYHLRVRSAAGVNITTTAVNSPVISTIIQGASGLVTEVPLTSGDVAVERMRGGGPDIATIQGGGPGQNEQQAILFSGGATAGTFTLTFDGQTTAPIAFDADGPTVRLALEALSNIAPGDVSVIAFAGFSAWRVDFAGVYANQDVPEMTAASNEVQEVTPPAGAPGTMFRLDFNGQLTNAIAMNANPATVQAQLEGLSNIAVGDILVSGPVGGPWNVTFMGAYANQNVVELFVVPSNETQRVELLGSPTGGAFSLTFNGQETTPISSQDSAFGVLNALENLPNINPGDVDVTGGSGAPWIIEFKGAFAGQDVPLMTISVSEVQQIDLSSLPPGGTFTLTFAGQTTTALSNDATTTDILNALIALPNIGSSDIGVSAPSIGTREVIFFPFGAYGNQDVPLLVASSTNEIQQIAPQEKLTGGTFRLTFSGQTTAAIPYNANATLVRQALESLNNIAPGDVVVTGTAGGPWNVEFTGTYAAQDVPEITINTDALVGGLTQGGYQLQLRLREVDEFGGATVRYANIRYAENGIRVLGQPTHSPLAGEHTETNTVANNTRGGAQDIGNLLNSDRGALAIAGELTGTPSGIGDVDWYEMEIRYDATQGTSDERWWSTIFDIDYADGFGRPQTVLHVFNSAGQLVLSSRDSNVADDRANPLNAADTSDLGRGGSGTGDSWIGSAELPEGTYYVAVSNEARVPVEYNQFFQSNAANALVRLEPINSVQRLVEDHIGSTGGSQVDVVETGFIDLDLTSNSSAVVPWLLNDVTLYVSMPGDDTNTTNLVTVDPFSGDMETVIGRFGQNVSDITLHPRGRMYTYSIFQQGQVVSDAQVGGYYQINPATGGITFVGDDGIQTYEQDPANANVAPVISNLFNNVRIGEGIHFRATDIAFWPGLISGNDYVGFAVGGRDVLQNATNDPPFQRNDPRNDYPNILYTFNPDSGAATGLNSSNRTGGGLLNGAATQIVERGVLNTSVDVNPPAGSANVITTVEATIVSPTGSTTFQIMDSGYPVGPLRPAEIPTTNPTPTTFQITASGLTRFFEFDAGPEARIEINPAANQFIQDAQAFNVNGTRVEFDTGVVLIAQTGAVNTTNYPVGSHFTVTEADPDPANTPPDPQTLTFEFVIGAAATVVPGTIPVQLNAGMSPNQVANAIAVAINSQQATVGFTTNALVHPTLPRVSLTNGSPLSDPMDDSDAVEVVNAPGLVIAGQRGLNGAPPAGTVRVRIEETSSQADLIDSLRRVNTVGYLTPMPVNTQSAATATGLVAAGGGTVQVGIDGVRVNFSGANTTSNISLSPTVFVGVGSQGGVGPAFPAPIGNRVAVPFLAEDTADDLAVRMQDAIRSVGVGAFLNAVATLDSVAIPGGFVDSAAAPLAAAAQAPGGIITGIATIDQLVYVVTDTGGVFQVLAPTSGGAARLDYLNGATALEGVAFSGLTAGPRNVEDGRYRQMLFAIDTTGELYAIGTQGAQRGLPQAIFASEFNPVTNQIEAQTSISTGMVGAHGVEFSNLDYNLWHATPNRNVNPGHGINITHDESRVTPTVPSNGGTSLYFGFENVTRNNVPSIQQYAPVAGGNNYDFPGGAYGSIETNTFSLKGYSSADAPTLYFNYFLETEQAGHNPNTPIAMRDSFRVFAGGDDGVWHLIGTNNGNRFTPNPAFPPNDDFDYTPGTVQETWDNTDTWRQARIPLGAFAGEDNLRLRFDFSTHGSMNVGSYDPLLNTPDNFTGLNTPTNGDELRGVDGIYLRDQHQFTLTGVGAGNRTFQLDMGYTLVAPTGANIPNGARFTIDGVGFEFDLNGDGGVTPGFIPVLYRATDSSSQVIQSIQSAIAGSPVTSPMQLNGNRLNLRGGAPGAVVGANVITLSGPAMPAGFVQGAPGVTTGIRIDVHAGMSRTEVTEAIAQVMSVVYAQGDRAQIKTHDEAIRLIGYRWVGQNPGPFADALNSRVLGITTALPGDEFGAFNASNEFDGSPNNPFFPGAQGAQNNAFEGVYIDDIIIGFAERGEMVTGSNAANDTFTANPTASSDNTVTGPYTLEIRRGQEAGVPNLPGALPPLLLLPQINANDRQTQSRVLEMPPGYAISDGLNFSLSDGIRTLTFEFNDLAIPGSSVLPGRVQINFRSTDTAAVMAQRVIQAIHSQPVQAVLKIAAQLSDGVPVPVGATLPVGSTTNLVNLIGSISVPNEGSGGTAFSGVLPTGPEVNNGTLIDNDVANNTVGHFQVQPGAGGSIFSSGVTVQGRTQTFINQNWIFQYLSYVDVGSDGGAIALSTTTITMPPTLIGDDLVASEGFFQGENGQVNWRVETFLEDGGVIAHNTLEFSSGSPLGNIQVINYLDEDVVGSGGDLLYQVGTPGQADFRLYTLDGGERIGFSQGGVYQPGIGLENATYDGWAADSFSLLRGAITGPGTTYTVAGNINTANLQPFNDARLGPVHGLADVTTAMAWTVNETETSATITTLLELLPQEPLGLVFRTITEQYGDRNLFRDQGQILLVGNEISHSANWGVLVDNGARTAADGNTPHQGPVRTLHQANTQRLIPGVVVSNNLIYDSGVGGILYSGDGGIDAAVPFGRIVNNTVYGALDGDVGIRVNEGAGPTLMNNIVANLTTGVDVQSAISQARTVLGGMLYQGNTTDSNVGLGGDFPIVLGPNDPLFVNAAQGNFYLAAQSQAIDSSVDSLLDRPALVTVKSPLGISPSPILAPDRDGVGQARVDDPSVATPGGFGQNVFKDRGAIDRVDFTGPTSVLVNPLDNDALGNDSDPTGTVVVLQDQILSNFVIRLIDRFDVNGPAEGSDIDDLSVTAQKVRVDVVGSTPRTLIQGIDYTFNYDATNNLIILTPLGGLWPLSQTYRITLDNGPNGISDRAANILLPNQTNGSHTYTIFLGTAVDWGDAPTTFGTQSTDTPAGPSHQIVNDVRMGGSNGAEADGQPSATADLDTSDDGVTNMLLQPGGPLDSSTVTIDVSVAGKIDAWLDLNQDGDFLDSTTLDGFDAGEYFLANFDVTQGTNVINLTLPNGKRGEAIVRFRFTTLGIGSPNGEAPDGEVEDYLVELVGPAFQNPASRIDVNNDGFLSPVDALLVIDYLNTMEPDINDQIPLPPVPPNPPVDPDGGGVPEMGRYLDVNGDGFLTPADAIIVIDSLNIAAGESEGEGEGEGESSSLAAAYAPRASRTTASSQTSDDSGSFSDSAIPSMLLISPDIVIEEREAVANSSPTFDPLWNNQHDFTLDLVAAPTASNLDAYGEALGEGEEDVLLGRVDDGSWESLLDELAADGDRSRG